MNPQDKKFIEELRGMPSGHEISWEVVKDPCEAAGKGKAILSTDLSIEAAKEMVAVHVNRAKRQGCPVKIIEGKCYFYDKDENDKFLFLITIDKVKRTKVYLTETDIKNAFGT